MPGKNTRILGDKPLISHSIDLAKRIIEIDDIFVSTDDNHAARIVKDAGVHLIDRPKELCADDSPELLAWRHAIEWVQHRFGDFDQFLSLPATSPLRNETDVRNSLAMLSDDADAVITVSESSRNPWFNMIQFDKQQWANRLVSANAKVFRHQDAPETYDMTTVAYVSRPRFILNSLDIFDGNVAAVVIPAKRALDIDTEFDFEIAEYLISKLNKGVQSD